MTSLRDDFFVVSLAKLIARDTTMSTLDALTNHLINEMMK
jgi:hypothetical protein